MNEVLTALRSLVEAEDYIKSVCDTNSSIVVYISNTDAERLMSQDWEYEVPRGQSNNELKCLYTFEGVSIRVDENLETDEYKIKINW